MGVSLLRTAQSLLIGRTIGLGCTYMYLYCITHPIYAKFWPRGYKSLSWSNQLSMKFIMLINVKMPTIVGILTFMSMVNTISEFESKKSLYFSALLLLCAVKILCSVELSTKKVL